MQENLKRNEYLERGLRKRRIPREKTNNNEKDEERQPFIVLDVNMDEEVYQIEFYKG